MDVTAVCQRVKAIVAVRAAVAAGAADRVALEGGLRAVGEVRSWLAAAEAELAAAVADVVSSPEDVVARAGRGSQGEAARVLGRSVTLGATPALAGALNAGATTPAHIDAVTKVAKGLEGSARDRLLARADGMVAAAGVESVRDFRSRLEREARRLRADDGMGVFQRQQAAVRVRRWTDGEGMWHLHGRFDPVTGVRLNARLQAEIEALFTDRVPEGCPTDPVERQEFLAALALASIMDGGGVAQRAGRPEFIVVIHADAAGETSETPKPGAGAGEGPAGDRGAGEGRSGDGLGVEWGLPVEVPLRVLAELFGHGDVHAVVVRGGVVLHAPGVLELGRSRRGWRTGPSGGRCGRCTRPVRFPGARPTSTGARSTTSAGGATAGVLICGICCRCACTTTARSTMRAGCSRSTPTGTSPSATPTAPSGPPAHPVAVRPDGRVAPCP
jgi:hypothetical protein